MKKKLFLLLIVGLIPMRAISAGTSELKGEVSAPKSVMPPDRSTSSQPTSQRHESDRFTGVWLSSSNPDGFNVTRIKPDGRFRTNHYSGIDVEQTLDGRWKDVANNIQWWYDSPPSGGTDINPILSSSRDHFSVRESNGSVTNFFRQGTTDSNASDFLPISLGTAWALKDSGGEMAIRISVREKFAGKDCYRVDWVSDFVYQSEYWWITEEGVFAVGRRAMDTTIEFVQPYLLLKRSLVPGDTWEAKVSFGSLNDVLKFSVGMEEEIDTSAGHFRAIPVTMRGRVIEYKRWYSKGIGLVREDSSYPGYPPFNEKKLSRKIQY